MRPRPVLLLAPAVAALALGAAAPARAQSPSSACRADELRVVLPALLDPAAPTATVRVQRSGRDPFDGPHGGTCVVQGANVTHVPDGARAVFTMPASESAPATLAVQGETVQVSLPAGAGVAFVSNACSPWRILVERGARLVRAAARCGDGGRSHPKG